jgi:hypothetical protein
MPDNINHPAHYAGEKIAASGHPWPRGIRPSLDIECIDAIEAATGHLLVKEQAECLPSMAHSAFGHPWPSEAFCTGCAIKYLWRWKKKGGAEDLSKARWYIDRLLEGLRKGEER